MNWKDVNIPDDEYGEPMFKGSQHLTNDKNEVLGSICWFYDEGPFYSHAMDVNNINLLRRIGPCTTLERAKKSVMDAIEGKLDISNRAGYQR